MLVSLFNVKIFVFCDFFTICAVCNFSTMMYKLRRQKKLKCSKNGKVSFYEKTGYATVDQHRRLVKREVSHSEENYFCYGKALTGTWQ